jgi:hypothetical protein
VGLALLPALVGMGPTRPRTELAGVGTLWRSSVDGRAVTVVVLTAGANGRAVLEGLRLERIDRIDLLVSPSGSTTAAALVASVRQRTAVDQVWVPRREADSKGRTPTVG